MTSTNVVLLAFTAALVVFTQQQLAADEPTRPIVTIQVNRRDAVKQMFTDPQIGVFCNQFFGQPFASMQEGFAKGMPDDLRFSKTYLTFPALSWEFGGHYVSVYSFDSLEFESQVYEKLKGASVVRVLEGEPPLHLVENRGIVFAPLGRETASAHFGGGINIKRQALAKLLADETEQFRELSLSGDIVIRLRLDNIFPGDMTKTVLDTLSVRLQRWDSETTAEYARRRPMEEWLVSLLKEVLTQCEHITISATWVPEHSQWRLVLKVAFAPQSEFLTRLAAAQQPLRRDLKVHASTGAAANFRLVIPTMLRWVLLESLVPESSAKLLSMKDTDKGSALCYPATGVFVSHAGDGLNLLLNIPVNDISPDLISPASLPNYPRKFFKLADHQYWISGRRNEEGIDLAISSDQDAANAEARISTAESTHVDSPPSEKGRPVLLEGQFDRREIIKLMPLKNAVLSSLTTNDEPTVVSFVARANNQDLIVELNFPETSVDLVYFVLEMFVKRMTSFCTE